MSSQDPPTKYPYGTPLSTMASECSKNDDTVLLSILSWNILAPVYVRPLDQRTGTIQEFAAFEWVKDDDVLDWNIRQGHLARFLLDCKADVICLQELQLENPRGTVPGWMNQLIQHYQLVIPPHDELDQIAERNMRVLSVNAAVTSAILLRRDSSWKLRPNDSPLAQGTLSVTVGLRYHEDGSPSVAVDPVVITSVHLDAMHDAKRVTQIARVLKRTRTLFDLYQQDEPTKGHMYSLTAIVAGDFNDEFNPGSCLRCLLKKNPGDSAEEEEDDDDDTITRQACAQALRLPNAQHPSDAQLREYKALRQQAADVVGNEYGADLQRVATGPTRCAPDHDCSGGRNTQQMAVWKLDHIVHSTDRLGTMAYWNSLEADPKASATGLPNAHHPSDHLAVAALFQVQHTHGLLTKTQQQDLKHQLVTLTAHHTEAVGDLERRMDAEHDRILATLAQQQPPTIQDAKCKKPKKKKNAPPPHEVIEFMRRKRALLKNLKEAQQLERQALADDLNHLQRLFITQSTQMHWTEWVKNGASSTI